MQANGDNLNLQTRSTDAKPIEIPQPQLPLKNHHDATCSYAYSEMKDNTPTYKVFIILQLASFLECMMLSCF
jgi:hypothetical protein